MKEDLKKRGTYKNDNQRSAKSFISKNETIKSASGDNETQEKAKITKKEDSKQVEETTYKKNITYSAYKNISNR